MDHPSQPAGIWTGDGAITVVIADDDRMFSSALEEVILSTPQLRLVGIASHAGEAIILTKRHRPDVVVLDVRMPGSGVEAARQIFRCSPQTTIIALSAYEDHDTVASMTGAGACQYLVKGRVSGDDVVLAIRRAARRV
jgi:DNA-binding NarL/FixJ family response regulator